MQTTKTVKKATTNKPRLNLLLDIALLLMFLIMYEVRATGEVMHEWLGVIMSVALLVHIILHWDRFMTIVRSLVHKSGTEARLRSVLNVTIFITFTAVMLSGFMISHTVMPFIGMHVEDSGFWHWLHHFATNAIIWLIALHIGLNWHWIINTTKRYLFTPFRQRIRPASEVHKARSI